MLKQIFQRNVCKLLPDKKLFASVSRFHLSANLWRGEDRRMMLKSLPAKDEGTGGERTIDIDNMIK